MTPEVWVSFVVASAILVAIPGPANLFLVSSTLQGGYRAGVPAVIGVGLGVLVSVFLALVGVSSILATSDNLFIALKVGGAAYLIYLGVGAWKTAKQPLGTSDDFVGNSITLSAFLVSVLNPKVLMFYVAFLPQFIDPHMPVFLQSGILMATFVLVGLINAGFWVYFARVSAKAIKSSSFLVIANRTVAALLIAAGCSVFFFP